MSRQIPSTRALQVFSAAAQHLSVSLAAEKLSVTHSALSQQLRKLEDQLGVKLFQRTARGIVLTEAGRRYREKVDDDLLRLEAHALEIMASRQGEAEILLGVVPVFAERWLIPRLGGFIAAHPHIKVQIKVFPANQYVPEPRYDAAIHYASVVWPGASAQALMQEECVAVCAPDAPFRRRVAQQDFRAVPLLHLNTRPQAWRDWFEQGGIVRRPVNPLAGQRFDLFSMLLEAVRAGLGIGLIPRYYVQRELLTREVKLAHPAPLAASQAYSLFVPQHRRDDPAVTTFASWLFAQQQAVPAE